MDLTELERLVATGESDTVEFKKSPAELTKTGETLCAFLNAAGGQVLIGVTPSRGVVGQPTSEATTRDIQVMLNQLEPPAPIVIETSPIPGGATVIRLVVPAAPESLPFTFRGRPYRRLGTATSLMPQEEYQRLLLERLHARRRWENEPARAVGLDDLDRDEIALTVRRGVEAGRLPATTGTDVVDILDRLGLRRDGTLLNAAVVLFGTRLLPDYPQCQLRLARFRGTDKAEFLDQRQLEGHAFRLLEEAMLFLRRHLPVAGRVLPGLFERVDEPLFPVEALREAVVNAFCHRDYTNPGGAVSLAVYDDRLEVWSDGTLPFGLRVEELRREHLSRPRNPLIAGVFYARGLVERWGRGTQTIIDLCVRAGHPEPEFLERAGAVGVRFVPRAYVAPHRVAHDLNDRQREILQMLARAAPLALRDIRRRLSNPPADRTLRDELLHLKRLGLVRLTGRGRGAFWSLQREHGAPNQAE